MAVRRVASRLAPGTPLFLIGDVGMNESFAGFVSKESKSDPLCGSVSGVVMIAVAQDGGAAGKRRSCSIGMPINDTPLLILDLCENESAVRVYRNNPNAIVVQVNEGKSFSKESLYSWVANVVLHFVDSTVRLRESWDIDVRKLRARL